MPDPFDEYDHENPEPEDFERAQRLFDRLAAEEPPLDLESDTAPARTAPRPAITEHTRPGAAVVDKSGQYVITLALGIALAITLVVTLMIFFNGEDDSVPVVSELSTITPAPAESSTIAPQLSASSTPVPTQSVILPTAEPERFIVELPPTAAVDEVGTWLLTPAVNGNQNVVSQSVLRQDGAFTIAGATARLSVVPYTVIRGDTLSGVASQYGLDICTLVWSNPRNKVSPLRPGNVLDVMPVDGVLYKIEHPVTVQQVADETGVNVFDILDSPYNDLFGAQPETQLAEGMKIVVPGGSSSNCNIWAAPQVSGSVAVAGSSGFSGAGGGSLWGCSYSVQGGGFPSLIPVAGNYSFFQGFSAAHTGVDLSAGSGTPVVASGGGTVAFAGWNEFGYGNAIVIDHGGSYTLYGHLSAINVGCNQQINAGDVIGAVGSTGRSSGPHLHFEIRDGGFNPMDPTFSLAL